MIAGLMCAALAGVLIQIFGAEDNWLAVLVALVGLWFALGGGERWFARRKEGES